MEEQKDLRLSEMLGGAVEARVQRALLDIAQNIDDPNTDAVAKRKLVVTLEFKPDKKRKAVGLKATVQAKLADHEAIASTVFCKFSRESGLAVLREIPDDQQPLFDAEAEKRADAVEAGKGTAS